MQIKPPKGSLDFSPSWRGSCLKCSVPASGSRGGEGGQVKNVVVWGPGKGEAPGRGAMSR